MHHLHSKFKYTAGFTGEACERCTDTHYVALLSVTAAVSQLNTLLVYRYGLFTHAAWLDMASVDDGADLPAVLNGAQRGQRVLSMGGRVDHCLCVQHR